MAAWCEGNERASERASGKLLLTFPDLYQLARFKIQSSSTPFPPGSQADFFGKYDIFPKLYEVVINSGYIYSIRNAIRHFNPPVREQLAVISFLRPSGRGVHEIPQW